jgi:hypothetical protein
MGETRSLVVSGESSVVVWLDDLEDNDFIEEGEWADSGSSTPPFKDDGFANSFFLYVVGSFGLAVVVEREALLPNFMVFGPSFNDSLPFKLRSNSEIGAWGVFDGVDCPSDLI